VQRAKKILAALVCLLFMLTLFAAPALAKSSGSKGGGFSSGGRSSFSSGSKGSPSTGKSYSSGSSSYSSKPSTGTSGSSSGSPAPSSQSSSVGSGSGSAPNTSSSKGYTTETKDFSTPRQGSPPAMYQDYQSGKGDYSTGTQSYTTGRQSFSGTWDRTVSPEIDRFPRKAPVGIFGSPPQPPYYYHNNYWGLPLWQRMLFQPNYYHTPWGYRYYAPRILGWVVFLGLLGGGGYLLYRYLSRRQM